MEKHPSILVIDDEQVVCDSCYRILSNEDYQVYTSTNPIEGYQKALNNNYDLLLLDICMDKMDGIQLLKKLRHIKSNIPVMIMTGYPSKETKEESNNLGVLNYISKPFQPWEIVEPIKSLFEHKIVPYKELLYEVIEETGIYFSDVHQNRENHPDISEISAYVKKKSKINAIWFSSDFPLTNVDFLAEKIKKNNLKRIIIAGDTPGEFKNFFTKAMIISGNDPDKVLLAGFKDYGAINKSSTDLAKAVLLCTIYGTSFEEVVFRDENPVNTETLIIGGGIAGIQASLEIANSGNKVYLVEKTGTIGGHMAMFDKTFPTLDCAACILTPKMVEVGQHANIELMTYSEIKEVSGIPGNYKIKILRKARHVNLKTCTGCGNCTQKCPSTVLSEFDAGITTRKAIYIPFPQAVPNKYLIDSANCRYVKDGKCGVCVKTCPVTNCINLDEKDTEVEITVGNIITATGYKPFNAKQIEDYGYGLFPNVLTSLELERLLNASGPTDGKIKFRTKDKKGNWIFSPDSEEPQSLAIIHCVGSRDTNHNKYCSRVCCMYSLKLAHLIKEKLPDANVYEYYIDMRASGKGYEEFYNRIKREGINIFRGRPASIKEIDNQLLLRSEDIMNDTLIEQKVDMVILAVGLEPCDDTEKISQILGISTTEEGWFQEVNIAFDPTNTFSGGITVAGVCQGPKDIPDTIAQASAAASKVLQSILKGKVTKGMKEISLNKIEKNVENMTKIKSYETTY